MIVNGDCLDELKKLGDECVELSITSPPYKDKDGFSYSLMSEVFCELYRVQKQNTLFFLNFGHLCEDKMRPFYVAGIALGAGYKLNDTITWVKNHYKPIQGKRRLNNLTEFIFLLYKGKMPELDRLSIGIPYVDKTNAKRFNKGVNLHCAGNIWYIDYPTINNSEEKIHHDMFPEDLSDRCIKLSGLTSGNVLDPFLGSGTVGISALKHGLNFIGIEKELYYYQIATERISKYNNELPTR